MGQRAPLFRQHGQRRVVAHRADSFLAVLDHRVEHGVEVFQCKAGGDLAAVQLFTEQRPRLRARRNQRLELDDVFQPALVVVLAGQGVDDFAFREEAAFFQVDGDHAAGRDVDAAGDAVFGNAGHAGFGTDDQQAVIGFGDA